MKQRDFSRMSLCMMKKHQFQYLIMILVIGISCGTFVLVQIVKSCLVYTEREMRLDQFGHFSGVIVNMKSESVNSEVIYQQDGGIIRVNGLISAPTYGGDIVLGELDSRAAQMLGVQLKDGNMPQNNGEIALMYQEYVRLDQLVPIGESISVLVLDPEGNVRTRSFTLSGILYDYNEKWNTAFSNIPDALLPTALTYQDGNTIEINAIYGESYFRNNNRTTPYDWFNGDYYSNYNLMNGDAAEKNRTELYASLAAIARVLLLVLLFVSCRTVTEAFYSHHFRSVQLLRLIGMNQSDLFRVFISIAIVICVFSLVSGILFGILFSRIAIYILNQCNIQIIYNFSILDCIIAGSSVFVIVTATFIVQIVICMKKPEIVLNPNPQQRLSKHSVRSSFFELYRKTLGRSRDRKMRYQTLMLTVISCTVFSVFYVSDMFSADFFNDLLFESRLLDADYAFLPIGGGCLPEYLNLEIIRDYGLTAEQINQINQSGLANTTLAVTGEYASVFLYLNEKTEPISNWSNRYSLRHQLETECDIESDIVFAKYGLKQEEDLLDYPIYGIPVVHLNENKKNLKEGQLHETAFQGGDEAVVFQAPDAEPVLHAGDVVTLYLYEFDNEQLSVENYQPRLTIKTVPISAIYQISSQKTNALEQFVTRSGNKQECLFISDQLMFSADRELRYSTVFVKCSDHTTDSSVIENELLDIYKTCRHGRYEFRNYVNLIVKQEQAAKTYKLPFLILVSLMVIILLLSFVFSNYTIRSLNSRTDYLCMAIGIRKYQQLSVTFWNDIIRCFRALLYGFLLFTLFILIFSKQVSWRFFITDALKSFLILAGMSLLISIMGSSLTVYLINTKQNVARTIQE